VQGYLISKPLPMPELVNYLTFDRHAPGVLSGN